MSTFTAPDAGWYEYRDGIWRKISFDEALAAAKRPYRNRPDVVLLQTRDGQVRADGADARNRVLPNGQRIPDGTWVTVTMEAKPA